MKVLETPSGAALIASFAKNVDREGGWVAIRKAYRHESGQVSIDADTQRIELPATLKPFGADAKWIRLTESGTEVQAVLIPNGRSRTSALQIEVTGTPLVVRMPSLTQVAARGGPAEVA